MDLLPQNRPEVTAKEGRFTYFPSNLRYTEGTFPSINNRSWTIEADLDVPQGGNDGMLVTQGGRFLGWGLLVLHGVPTFLYRSSDTHESLTRLAGSSPLAPGSHHITVRFDIDGPGLGRGGALAMQVDGRTIASGRLDHTVVAKFASEGATVGFDTGTALQTMTQHWDGTAWSPVGDLSWSNGARVFDLAVYDGGSGPKLYAFTTSGYDSPVITAEPRLRLSEQGNFNRRVLRRAFYPLQSRCPLRDAIPTANSALERPRFARCSP